MNHHQLLATMARCGLAVLALTAGCTPLPQEAPLFPATATCKIAADPVGQPPALVGGERIAQFLDVSAPVGGFLEPKGEPRNALGIRNLLSQTGPLLQEAIPAASLSSWTFANGITEVANGAFSSPKFSGEGSDLREPIQRVQAELTAGSLSAAIIVTDLVGTCDTLGASCAAPPMVAWIRDTALKAGFSVGLVGVRAPYFGVKNRVCPGVGAVGCRFSENRSAWVKMDAPAEVPLFALVFSRTPTITAKLVASIQGAMDPEGKRSLSEDFTAPRAEQSQPMNCALGAEAGPMAYGWVTSREGRYSCNYQEKPFEVRCKQPALPAGFTSGSPVLDPAWNGFATLGKASAGTIALTVACRDIDDAAIKFPATALSTVASVSEVIERPDWAAWSVPNDSEADALGKTLRLAPFVDLVRSSAVRPARNQTCSGMAPAPWHPPSKAN